MSSPNVAPGGSGKAGKRGIARAELLAAVAVVSVVALIDSEIVAYLVPGIWAATEVFGLPTAFAYGALAVLAVTCLWLTAWLVRRVWAAERAMSEPPEPAAAPERVC